MGVATLGAILSDVARSSFLAAAYAAGLNSETSATAVKHVLSSDLNTALDIVPAVLKDKIHAVALAAFADGFASASLMTAAAAVIAACLAWLYVAAEPAKLAQAVEKKDHPCMVVDCRHPI
jgi:hypothetical protein